jgi:hypothetical protein
MEGNGAGAPGRPLGFMMNNGDDTHGGAGDGKRRGGLRSSRNVVALAEDVERWGVICVGDGEMKNDDDGGHYPVVDAVDRMRQGGHDGPTTGIQAAWREKGIGDGQSP